MSFEFMQRMMETYDRVHNRRYWNELDNVLANNDGKHPTIMDIGCGPGLLLKNLVPKLLPSKIYAVDLSPIMLKQANQLISDEINTMYENGKISNKDNISLNLIEQHLQENPSLPSDIDIIFSSRVIRSFEDQEAIMTSIFSSLKSGGYFVLVDWTRASINDYMLWFEQKDNEFEDLTNWEVVKYHRIFSRYDLDDWCFILKTAGFVIDKQFQIDAVHSCVIAKKP